MPTEREINEQLRGRSLMPGLQDISSGRRRGTELEVDWITMQSTANKSLRELEYDRALALWENNEMADELFYEKVKRMGAQAPTQTEKEKWFGRQKGVEGRIFTKNITLKENRLELDFSKNEDYKGLIDGYNQLAQMAAASGDENLSLSYLLKAQNAKNAFTQKGEAAGKKATAKANEAAFTSFSETLGKRIRGLTEIGEMKKTGSSVKDYVEKLDGAFKGIFDAVSSANIPADVKNDLYSLITGQKNWELGERGGLNADDLVNFFKDTQGESSDKTNASYFASQQELINKVKNNPDLGWWFIQQDDGSWRIGLEEEAPADKYVAGRKIGQDGKIYSNYSYLLRDTGLKDDIGNKILKLRDFDDLSQPTKDVLKDPEGNIKLGNPGDYDFDFSPSRQVPLIEWEDRRGDIKKAYGELLKRNVGTLEKDDPEGFNHYLREWKPGGKALATIDEIRQDMRRSAEYKERLLREQSEFARRSDPGYAAGEFSKGLLGSIGGNLAQTARAGVGFGKGILEMGAKGTKEAWETKGTRGITPTEKSVDYMGTARTAAAKGWPYFKSFWRGLTR